MYSDWKAENPNTKLSKSKFCQMRPPNVKSQNNRKLIQCLCEYCENVSLKLNAFNKLATKRNKSEIRLRDKFEAVNMILCNKNGKQFHNIECVEGKCLKCGTETHSKRMEPLIITNEGAKVGQCKSN